MIPTIERSDIRSRKFEKCYPWISRKEENETIQIWTVFLTVILGALRYTAVFKESPLEIIVLFTSLFVKR